jgi:cytochrome c oxidase accessory protein FixG
MCPWPRFQSAMLDEQSLIVTYQGWRGEPRGHARGTTTAQEFGDCVDCLACVHVCPTGIDIRDGVQLECINCGLCVDACNHVMEKMERKPWLITWDTLTRQKAKAAGRTERLRLLRPRTFVYAGILAVGCGLFVVGILDRATTNLSIIHDRAPLFIRLQDGGVRNGFTIKLANKLQVPARYSLQVAGLADIQLSLPEDSSGFGGSVRLNVPAGEVGNFRLLVQTHTRDLVPRPELLFSLHNETTGETRRIEAPFFTRDADRE